MRSARKLLCAAVLSAVAVTLFVPTSPASASPSSAAAIQKQIDTQSTALEKIVEQYDGVNQQLQDDQATEVKLTNAIAPTLVAYDDAHSKVADLAAQAYMAGPISTISTLISSDNTADLINEMGTMNEIATTQKQQVASFQKTITAYNTQKQKLDNLILVEKAQRTSLAAQKKTIDTKLTSLYVLRKKAYGSATVKSGGSEPTPPYLPGRGGKIVAFAYKQLGKPYAWAADGPGSYDCSGLVTAAYRSVGISVPHQSSAQWKDTHHISRSQLSPGDLVFYQSGDLHHVAIYIGKGNVIHAPTFGDVVKISPVTMMSVYGYGRIG